jgi:hypothetical protein
LKKKLPPLPSLKTVLLNYDQHGEGRPALSVTRAADCADVRRGVAEADIAEHAYVMVFTLDWFLYMSRELKSKVLDEAKALADKDGQITDEDRKPVVFCAIHELEAVLSIATEDTFLAALEATQKERFKTWQFREVYRDSTPEKPPRKDYPFKLEGVLPWWRRTQDLIEAFQAKPATQQ